LPRTPPRAFPDGCETAGEADVAPPCIRTAYTRTVPNDDYPEMLDVELVVVVDRDAQYVRLVLQPAYGGRYADRWQLQDPDWWYKCGLDEASLAWALTEALNSRSLAYFDAAYNAPLPAPFVDLVIDLIEAEDPTPTPTVTLTSAAMLTPVPTVDSSLFTPTP
jgi:hypothetical protein